MSKKRNSSSRKGARLARQAAQPSPPLDDLSTSSEASNDDVGPTTASKLLRDDGANKLGSSGRSSRQKGPIAKDKVIPQEPEGEYNEAGLRVPARRKPLDSAGGSRKIPAISQQSSGLEEMIYVKKAGDKGQGHKKGKDNDAATDGDQFVRAHGYQIPANLPLKPRRTSIARDRNLSGPTVSDLSSDGSQGSDFMPSQHSDQDAAESSGDSQSDTGGTNKETEDSDLSDVIFRNPRGQRMAKSSKQAVARRLTPAVALEEAAIAEIDHQNALLPFHKTTWAKAYRHPNTAYLERYGHYTRLRQRVLRGEEALRAPLNDTLAELIKIGTAIPARDKIWQIRRRARAWTTKGHSYNANDPHLNLVAGSKHNGSFCEMFVDDVRAGFNEKGAPIRSESLRHIIDWHTPSMDEFRRPEFQRRLATAIEAMICGFGNEVPRSKGAKSLMLNAAFQYAARSDHKPAMLTPTFSKTHGLRASIKYIDATTMKEEFYPISSYYGFRFRVIPKIDPNTVWYKGAGEHQGRGMIEVKREKIEGVITWPTCLPEYHEIIKQDLFKSQHPVPTYQELLNRELLMRKIITEMTGLITTKEKLDQLRERIEGAYGRWPAVRQFSTARVLPHIDGFGLLYITASETTTFGLSGPASRIIGMKTLASIRTYDARWLAIFFDRVRDVLRTTNDPFQAAFEAWECVDLINSSCHIEGEEPPVSDQCDDGSRGHTSHACHRCLAETPCLDLIGDRHEARYCSNCDTSEDGATSVVPLQRAIHRAVRFNVRRDAQGLGMDADDPAIDVMIKEGVDALSKDFAGHEHLHFKNVYRLEPSSRYTIGDSAFRRSIDALLPAFRRADGSNFPHSAGNMGWCYTFENFAKARHLPGSEVCIARWSRGELDNQQLIDELERWDRIERGIPLARANFLRKLSEEHWEALRYEFLTGDLLNPDNLNKRQREGGHAPFNDGSRFHRKCEWDQHKKDDIVRICEQIIEYFRPTHNEQATLSYASDGTPWPSVFGTMPEEFCWDWLFSYMRCKLSIFTLACNRRWVTVDTEFTLFLEIVWGAHLKAGLLGLPVTLRLYFVLRVSIGKIDHGLPMVGRFHRDAKSIDDRDDKVANTLVETWRENAARKNHIESEVARIPDEQKKFYAPKFIYDPDMKRPEHLARKKFPLLEISQHLPEDPLPVDEENRVVGADLEAMTEEERNAVEQELSAAGLDDDEDPIFSYGPRQQELGSALDEPQEEMGESVDQVLKVAHVVPKTSSASISPPKANLSTKPTAIDLTTSQSKGTQEVIIIPDNPAATAVRALDALPRPPSLAIGKTWRFAHERCPESFPWDAWMNAFSVAYDKGVFHHFQERINDHGAEDRTLRVGGKNIPCLNDVYSLRPNLADQDSYATSDLLAVLISIMLETVPLPSSTFVQEEPNVLFHWYSHCETMLSPATTHNAAATLQKHIDEFDTLRSQELLEHFPFIEMLPGCTNAYTLFNMGLHWAAVHYQVDYTTSTGRTLVHDSLGGTLMLKAAQLLAQYMSMFPGHVWHNITWHEEPVLVPSPRQGNGRDCRLFALESIRTKLAKEEPKFHKSTAFQLRAGEDLRARHAIALAERAGILLAAVPGLAQPMLASITTNAAQGRSKHARGQPSRDEGVHTVEKRLKTTHASHESTADETTPVTATIPSAFHAAGVKKQVQGTVNITPSTPSMSSNEPTFLHTSTLGTTPAAPGTSSTLKPLSAMPQAPDPGTRDVEKVSKSTSLQLRKEMIIQLCPASMGLDKWLHEQRLVGSEINLDAAEALSKRLHEHIDAPKTRTMTKLAEGVYRSTVASKKATHTDIRVMELTTEVRKVVSEQWLANFMADLK